MAERVVFHGRGLGGIPHRSQRIGHHESNRVADVAHRLNGRHEPRRIVTHGATLVFERQRAGQDR
jgi:predicted alpha/beta-fold hydrolase